MDTIMLFNVSTYLVNSLGEKWLYSERYMLRWIDKEGFSSLLGKLSYKLKQNREEADFNGDSNG
jgi:hypothetical protein